MKIPNRLVIFQAKYCNCCLMFNIVLGARCVWSVIIVHDQDLTWSVSKWLWLLHEISSGNGSSRYLACHCQVAAPFCICIQEVRFGQLFCHTFSALYSTYSHLHWLEIPIFLRWLDTKLRSHLHILKLSFIRWYQNRWCCPYDGVYVSTIVAYQYNATSIPVSRRPMCQSALV